MNFNAITSNNQNGVNFKHYLVAFMLIVCSFVASNQLMAAEAEQAAEIVTEAVQQIETVNINTASAEDMAKVIKGVGEKKAQAIVAFRTENGLFAHPSEIIAVKGIGEKTYEKNKEKITIE